MTGGRRWPVLLSALAIVASACSLTVDPLDDPGIGESALTTIVYAADGSVLAHWHAGEDRSLVLYEDLPRHLIDAVVAIEDERFWTHPGIDVRAILRAAQANAEADAIVQGGSTITQQYLKNVLLTPARTLERKLEEASLAIRLEANLTKEQILERYLNTIYFGDGAYGVGTAAAHYFGKNVSDLTLAESALLAALIQRPAAINPRDNYDAAVARRRVVLDKMVELGLVAHADAQAADRERIELSEPAPLLSRSRFPYFTEALKQELLDDPILGSTPTDRYNALFRGGLRIYTTIDPALQIAAEEATEAVLPDGGPDAALVSIEPRTGYVRAIVGGKDFYDSDDPIANFNLALQGRRQPGSAFKPFVLAAALEQGIGLYDIWDAGRTVEIETDSRIWQVENYNEASFPDLTVLEATVYSVNVVYARLIDDIGPAAVADLAARVGIETPLEPFHSLALGAQEVNALEMASAFGTFASGGLFVEPTMWTAITTHEGEVLHENEPAIDQRIAPEVAQLVTNALTEVVRRGTGTQARIGRPTSGKTGTSQDHRDAWFIGYTPELSTSVWVGFAQENIPMEEPTTDYTVTGGVWPAEIWARYTSAALSNVPFGQLSTLTHPGHVSVDVDLSTGYLAGPLCPHENVHRLELPAEAVPTVICPIHNPTGLVVSAAGEVPDVMNLSVGEAIALLERAGYEARIDWADGGSLEPGTVFGQSPAAAEPAQPGSLIRLTLAGPAPGSVVPNILGYTLDAAIAELNTYGIGFELIEEAESGEDGARRRAGRVWKQSPPAGSDVDGRVRIWVNPA